MIFCTTDLILFNCAGSTWCARKSEQTAEDMLDIVRHVHKYVPQTKGVIAERILYGSD